MVASFPEFDYPRHRSSKGGCVFTTPKPNRLRSALHLKSPADSSLLTKILSFHGSFIHNNRDLRKFGAQLLPGSGSSTSKLKRTKSSNSSISSADIQSDKSLNVGAQHCDSASSAIKIGRKWRSYKSSRPHLSASGLQEETSHLFQAGCDSPGKHGATKVGNLTSKLSKTCSPQSSAMSQLGSQNGPVATPKYEVDDFAHTSRNPMCSTQPADLINNKSNVGAQKTNSIDVSKKSEPISINVGAQKPDSIDVGVKDATLSSVDGRNELESSNSAHQSKPTSEVCVCNEVELAGATQIKENCQKISSSAVPGAPNFSSENYSLYASDNSSNNMRCSSTSCASTDTSSSNSTRRSSCESRIPSAVPQATFLAKPHKAHDTAWAAIRSLQLRQGGAPLAITHFNLIRRVGHGDIGSVFLANLKDKLVASPLDASCLFAVKVMDKDALALRNKIQRMHMEKEILECVDHPFLPTLYAHFDSEHFSCLVMDFCPGGDLYALRQKQPGKRFGLIAARFFAAEVLLALEYLHMLGIVYRDLKPENVLVREDGHIMLTDFDLSLKADVKPELVKHPLLASALLSNSSSKRWLLRSYSQSSTVSSSLTTPFLHHESTTCRLPAACSIDPLISCLTLTNNSSKRAPQVPNGQSPIGYSMLSTKASKASHAHTLNYTDGSITEPLKVSKQDVLGPDQSTPSKEDMPSLDSTPSTSNGGSESARFAKMFSRSNTSRTHHRAQLSKESHDSPSAHMSQGAETGMATPSSLGCQEEDHFMFMELVAEPTQARSMSFVGTHEYLAPEIIAGSGHGSPVDWWTFGIFLYELLYGRSPFKGASNDQTLINIIRQSLRFPEMVGYVDMEGMEDAKSLIGSLLMKDPRRRLGCAKGATEIKQHAFFKGVNWALIRCTQPPEVPSPCKKGMHAATNHNKHHHHHRHHQHQSKALHQFDFF